MRDEGRRAPPPRLTWVPRLWVQEVLGNGLWVCGGSQAVHLPPQREKSPSGDFPNRLWVCPLNHGGLVGFKWAYSGIKLLPLPAPASLRCRVEILGCFLFPHRFLQSWHHALTSRWAWESCRAFWPPRGPSMPTFSFRPWLSSPGSWEVGLPSGSCHWVSM